MPSNTMHGIRLANLHPQYVAAYSVLSLTTPKSLATVATALGATVDAAEKLLSGLIDESLAVRSTGQRDVALYTAL
jgi:RNase P/RNase MRP subunit p30